jgi:predicted DNA-binding protein (MmcQ/YjbR family)
MKIKEYNDFCLSFHAVSEDFPTDDEETHAFKVMGKPFSLTNPDSFERITLKCDPVKAATLRNLYEEVQPGKHMGKRHWNTINPNGKLDDEIIKEWIKDSYDLVVESLPRKKQRKIEAMQEEE